MSDVTGRTGKLAVSTNGSTYNDVGGVKSVSFSIGRATIDVTDFDSSGWEEHLVGNGNVSMSFVYNYDEDDSSQDTIHTSNENSTQIYYRYRPITGAPGKEYIIQGTITSFDVSGSQDGAVEISATVTGTGTPTVQDQS